MHADFYFYFCLIFCFPSKIQHRWNYTDNFQFQQSSSSYFSYTRPLYESKENGGKSFTIIQYSNNDNSSMQYATIHHVMYKWYHKHANWHEFKPSTKITTKLTGCRSRPNKYQLKTNFLYVLQ